MTLLTFRGEIFIEASLSLGFLHTFVALIDPLLLVEVIDHLSSRISGDSIFLDPHIVDAYGRDPKFGLRDTVVRRGHPILGPLQI